MKSIKIILLVIWIFTNVHCLIAQETIRYQTDFAPHDFAERRTKVLEAIGDNAIALIQGANGNAGFNVFRQTNSFYYLCGIESAHAYLLLNGNNKRATLYLPHRDVDRERGEGKVLSAEDAAIVKELTGVDRVRGLEFLSADLVGSGLIKPPGPVLFTPFSPAETGTDSRDELLFGQARIASDPWDGRPSREAHLQSLLHQRFPQYNNIVSCLHTR